MKTLTHLRYPLLAASVLSAIVVPQWVGASDRSADGRIVVAQNVDPKDKNKGKQPPAKSNAVTPGAGNQQGGQPKQTGNPPANNLRQGRTGQPGSDQPGGTGQPKGFSKQGPGNQFQKGPTGSQQNATGQPGGTGQPKGFSKQGPGNQFQQGPTGNQQNATGQPGGTGQPKGFSKQGPGNQFQKGPTDNQKNATGQDGKGQPKTFSKQGPGNLQQGSGPTNQQFGSIEQLRSQRQTHKDTAGRTVIQEGNRSIVKDGSRTFIRSDDSARFGNSGNRRVEQRGGETYTYFARDKGFSIVNVTDRDGNLIRRVRRGPDGREVILIDNRRRGIGPGGVAGLAVGAVAAGVFLGLAAPAITIPSDQYIVDMDAAPPEMLYDTLEAPPLVALERPYTLDEIRYNVELRDRMRRIDINTITFESGSWTVTPDQYDRLAAIADAMSRVLRRHPDEIFMIEGHTDAVGSDDDNLSLSDRRAESVATILSDHFRIPPENLVTQGYGEQYLKVPTQEALRANRRVAVRRIGPLLAGRAY